MQLLKTFRHIHMAFIEIEYKKRYPTLLLKQSEFFNSINRCAFVPVHIGYTYSQTNGETS